VGALAVIVVEAVFCCRGGSERCELWSVIGEVCVARSLRKLRAALRAMPLESGVFDSRVQTPGQAVNMS